MKRVTKATPRTPSGAFTEIGSTGLKRQSGQVYEEFLRELKGSKATKVYREMSENDPIIGAVLIAIKTLVAGVSWRVEAASDDSADMEVAEFIESARHDMSSTWNDVISEVCSMFTYGWSTHEIVYKRRDGESNDPTKNSKYTDGRIAWRKFPIRSQESLYEWQFDETGGVQGFRQQSPFDSQIHTIPMEKALLFRTSIHKNNPQGRSLLRNSYRSWYFKKRIEEIEGIGIERDLAGLPVAWVPAEIMQPNASAEMQATKGLIETLVQNIRRDEQEGVVMPLDYDINGHKRYDLTLLSTAGSRQFDTSEIVGRYDQRIAQSVLADVILIGHEKVGSWALSDTKLDLFTLSLQGYIDGMADVFNRFAIARVLRLNGISLQQAPRLVAGSISRVNLEELSNYIQKISGAGAPLFPDDGLENHLRKVAKLPEKSVDEVPEEG